MVSIYFSYNNLRNLLKESLKIYAWPKHVHRSLKISYGCEATRVCKFENDTERNEGPWWARWKQVSQHYDSWNFYLLMKNLARFKPKESFKVYLVVLESWYIKLR